MILCYQNSKKNTQHRETPEEILSLHIAAIHQYQLILLHLAAIHQCQLINSDKVDELMSDVSNRRTWGLGIQELYTLCYKPKTIILKHSNVFILNDRRC